jgi:hypothetical protein
VKSVHNSTFLAHPAQAYNKKVFYAENFTDLLVKEIHQFGESENPGHDYTAVLLKFV